MERVDHMKPTRIARTPIDYHVDDVLVSRIKPSLYEPSQPVVRSPRDPFDENYIANRPRSDSFSPLSYPDRYDRQPSRPSPYEPSNFSEFKRAMEHSERNESAPLSASSYGDRCERNVHCRCCKNNEKSVQKLTEEIRLLTHSIQTMQITLRNVVSNSKPAEYNSRRTAVEAETMTEHNEVLRYSAHTQTDFVQRENIKNKKTTPVGPNMQVAETSHTEKFVKKKGLKTAKKCRSQRNSQRKESLRTIPEQSTVSSSSSSSSSSSFSESESDKNSRKSKMKFKKPTKKENVWQKPVPPDSPPSDLSDDSSSSPSDSSSSSETNSYVVSLPSVHLSKPKKPLPEFFKDQNTVSAVSYQFQAFNANTGQSVKYCATKCERRPTKDKATNRTKEAFPVGSQPSHEEMKNYWKKYMN